MEPFPELLTAREVAAALRCAPKTVHRLIESGALVAMHLEGSSLVRVPADELRRYMQASLPAPRVSAETEK